MASSLSITLPMTWMLAARNGSRARFRFDDEPQDLLLF